MNKHSFDAGWEFTDAVGMFGMRFGQWQPVTLPHDYSITQPRAVGNLSGSGGGYAKTGTISYRKKFNAPAELAGMAAQFEFEGVYMNAEVSINGHLAALQPYGYSSFLVDLKPYLKMGRKTWSPSRPTTALNPIPAGTPDGHLPPRLAAHRWGCPHPTLGHLRHHPASERQCRTRRRGHRTCQRWYDILQRIRAFVRSGYE